MHNLLISALSRDTLARWAPEMQKVYLPLGSLLADAQENLRFCYFPLTAIVSIVCLLENGASAETALIGNDGMVDVAVFMGGASTVGRAVVQGAGTAIRIPAAALIQEFSEDPPTRDLLLRYTQALIAQMALTAACNRHHAIDQQFCRWLLMTTDRVPAGELLTTHEAVAHVLGVRRESVTEAAARLQRAGLLRHSRGRMEVIDREAVEARACECYRLGRNTYRNLLPECAEPPAAQFS